MSKPTVTFHDRAYEPITPSFTKFPAARLRAAVQNLQKTLGLFGPTGAQWRRDGNLGDAGKPTGQFCLLGGVTFINGPGEVAARTALALEVPRDRRRQYKFPGGKYRASLVYGFNDSANFAEVVEVLKKSIKRLQREVLRRKKVSK